MEDIDILYTEQEAAELLRVSPKTLQKRRCMKKPPAYLNLSGTIRYRASDLREYIESSVVDPEREAEEAQ